MINCVKQPNPNKIQALPEFLINGEVLANKLEDSLKWLSDTNFIIRVIVIIIPQMSVLLVEVYKYRK